jgi:hypothetical protein
MLGHTYMTLTVCTMHLNQYGLFGFQFIELKKYLF